MNRVLWGAVFCGALVSIGSACHAAAIYRYQGQNYETAIPPFDTTMSLTGTVEFAAPLAPNLFDRVFPVGFRFDDGLHTITQQNAESSAFGFATDNLGSIVGWQIMVDARDEAGNSILIDSDKLMLGGQDLIIAGPIAISSTPGSWSLVPLPPAIWIFASGLIGLIAIARRTRA